MASRYWVGGTGNWDASDTTHWSATSGGVGGASVPGVSDTITFDASSGGGTVTVTATQSVTSITGGAFTGTLNTNGQSITCSGGFSFSGTATRTLTLGASTITCGQWNIFTTTNLTFNANTSTVAIIPNQISHSFGGLNYNIIAITYVTVNQTLISNVPGSVTTFTVTGNSTKDGEIEFAGNFTVSGTFTINGNSTINRLLVKSNTVGTSRTLTVATVTVTNADFQDITGAGAGSWNLSGITGGSGDCGGNSGITFSTPADQHWTNASSGNWSSSGNWTSRVPLPQDNVFMDKAFGTSQTVTADMPRLGKSIDWTGATWTTSLTWNLNASCSIFGSLTMITGLTESGGLSFIGRGNHTITTNGVSVTSNILFAAFGGTYTLQDTFTNTSTNSNSIQHTHGTLDLNNQNMFLSGGFQGTGSSVRTLTMGSGTISLGGTGTIWNFLTTTNLTLNAATSTIKITNTSSTANTFVGGSKTYNNIWFARGPSTGTNTITGSNTFNDFKDDGTAAHSILFTTGTTQTVSTFTVSGTAGNLISIDSTTTGTHALVKSGGGTISCDYLNIQHSVVTPVNTWYAGSNSTNNQSTATAGSGWIFRTLQSLQGNFLSFF